MPPKQTSEQINVRLDELEAFIRSNAASIATPDADSMLAVLTKRRRQSPEAEKFRRWLHKTESKMTRLQQQRVIDIFELLTALSDKSSKSDTKARSSDTSQLSSDVLRGLKKSYHMFGTAVEQTRVSGYCGDLPAAVACPNDNGTS